jgi:hypothetical protein
MRQNVFSAITSSHVGYYADPVTVKMAVYAPLISDVDARAVKMAAAKVSGSPPLFLSYQELEQGNWVKIAASPTLRRAGELLNFFPGQYAVDISNNPSPLAAMLTSGLLGAGLGWGAGKLIGKLAGPRYGGNLGRTGLLLGGAIGAAPGMAWGLTNKINGRKFNDDSLLSGAASSYPDVVKGTTSELSSGSSADPGGKSWLGEMLSAPIQLPTDMQKKSEWKDIQLSKTFLASIEKVASTFGYVPNSLPQLPADVNIDALGRTLWNIGASPALAASTMGTMYAAQQLPDPQSRPGVVTGNQLGTLAVRAAGDYAKGYLAGVAINAVVGTPFRAPVIGGTNAIIGVLGTVVPKIFGG